MPELTGVVPRLGLPARIAVGAIRRLLATRWQAGTLVVELPDGDRWTFAGAGGRRATLVVKDWRFFRRVLLRSDVGLGESYVAGEWECDDLVGVVRLLLAQPAIAGERTLRLQAVVARLRALLPRHPGRDVRAHYDLGNEFFALFLDESMTYSAATFATPDTSLAEAQRDKLDGICRSMGLGPGMRVLDVGCGWGAFAMHAARAYGCRVVGVTLSPAQHALACARVRDAGLADRVDVRLDDYGGVDGAFDRIVSIEMFEAIGWHGYRRFFRTCDGRLAADGRMFLQTTVYPDRGFDAYRRDVDWIRAHVFPGNLLGSLRRIVDTLARDTSLRIESLRDIALDYAATLRAWRGRFLAELPAVRALGYDDRFIRKWHLYLAMCEAAFAARHLATLQIVLAR